MKLDAKKIVLPYLLLTEVATKIDSNAIAVFIPQAEDPTICETYHVTPKLISAESENRNGEPHLVKHHYNYFPIVMDKYGVPWAEAIVYILSRLESVTEPAMATY